jgi:hypothetical protein
VIVLGLIDPSPDSPALRELRTLASQAPVCVEVWLGGRGLEDQSKELQERVTSIPDLAVLERKLRQLRRIG